MPAKMARSAPRPPFGVPRMTAAVRAATPVLPESGKSAKIHDGSGFIWGIPVETEARHHTGLRCRLRRLGADRQLRGSELCHHAR